MNRCNSINLLAKSILKSNIVFLSAIFFKHVQAFWIAVALGIGLFAVSVKSAPVTIAQISDTHLGEAHSPRAAEHLRAAVTLINARHPDAVILTGDIGESAEERQQAAAILKSLNAPIYYVPGNHDISDTNSLARYRTQFGPDYYVFHVRNVEVLVLDSQLLGNYTKYDSPSLLPLLPGIKAENKKMLDWLAAQPKPAKGEVVIAVQHIPLYRDTDFPDARPYWTVNPPYARREVDLLHKLGVKHLLAGHWHTGRIFEHERITVHVAPATSWLPFGGQLGFAMHTITPNGDVHTEFVPLP
jgi:3',5'-cyclic AMP phosphodiesterase CpdA